MPLVPKPAGLRHIEEPLPEPLYYRAESTRYTRLGIFQHHLENSIDTTVDTSLKSLVCPRGSSDRSEMVSNGQKAGRERAKVREYLSSFPFFLDHTWHSPTALRFTFDLVTFSLIPREFETGKRNFASGGSRPSDRGERGAGGGGVGRSSRPWDKRGPGPLPWIRHCLPANTVISSLSSPQGSRNVSRGGERGGTALLAG